MEILRTPDERFANLPGYSFEPHYVNLGELRIVFLENFSHGVIDGMHRASSSGGDKFFGAEHLNQ